MNKKKLVKIGGVAVVAAMASMAMVGCAGDAGADGAQGVAGVDGKDGIDGKDGTDGIDGKDGVSCSAKALEDGTGYALTCGDKEIGKILNGTNGIEGKAGASCSAAPNADTTGYVISCDGKEVGLIKNGIDGKDGINGIDGKDGDDGVSCFATPLADESGFTLTCGDETIGTIMNGKAGQSCSGKSVVDEKTKLNGVEIVCGDAVVDTIWTGEKGDAGTSCTMAENTQKTGYAVTCGGEMVGTILHGTAGESCSVADTTNAVTGKTGYKLTCGEEVKGVVWNGTDGENAKTIYTMGMMNAGGTLREYVASDDGSIAEGSVETGKGTGSLETWVGANAVKNHDYQIKTGGDATSGWWYAFTDDEGSSIVLPAQIPENQSKDAVIDACNGFCGSVSLDGNAEFPYTGVGFNIVKGQAYKTSGLVGTDISNWQGVCVAYSAGGTSGLQMFVKVNNQNEKDLTDWNSYRFYLPMNNSGIINIPWSAFKQVPGGPVPEGGLNQILEQAASVNVEFHGAAGEAGYFNIQKIGMYGHCGNVIETPVVEEPNPYEGIPQYVYVSGTNIMKPAKIADADKGTDFNTWRGVDGNAMFPNGRGYISFYSDANDIDPENAAKNRSEFSFPVSDHDPAYRLITESHVEACDGICGSIYLNENTDGDVENRYAGIYFNVKHDEEMGSNLTNAKGLCLTYTLKSNVRTVYLRVDPVDEQHTTGYNYHRKALPNAETPITLNIPWSEFKQDMQTDGEGNLLLGVEKSIDYVVKQAASIQVFFEGDAGHSADFNIMQLGAYGNCD